MTSDRGAGPARPLQGVFLPVATPFDHNGDLYRAKLQHNIEKWNRTALAGYVVCGAAGESVSLTREEKTTLWGWAAEFAAPDKLLIAGVGTEGVREIILQIGQAAAMGYSAALVATPCSYRDLPTRELYFRAVADQAKVPIIAAVGASDDPEAALEMKPHGPSLAGSVTGLWDSLSAGAVGAVLACANAAPYSVITIWQAHRGRHTETGLDWQERINHAAHLVTAKYGVPGLKHAMDLNGYYGGPCRLPLVPPTPEAKREIEAAFRDLRG